MRQLEERNAGHAERTRQLEEELRRAGSLRAQLEAQRLQVPGGWGAWGPVPVSGPLQLTPFALGTLPWCSAP